MADSLAESRQMPDKPGQGGGTQGLPFSKPHFDICFTSRFLEASSFRAPSACLHLNKMKIKILFVYAFINTLCRRRVVVIVDFFHILPTVSLVVSGSKNHHQPSSPFKR